VPVIALVAVAVPVLLGLAPRLPIPGAVLEVLAGILIGPSVLGWVHLDAPVRVLSDLGLGMLLFLAGLEIDVDGLRGPLGRLASCAFAGSVLLGVACGYALSLVGVHAKPVFLAVVLVSTAAAEIPLFLLALLVVRGRPRPGLRAPDRQACGRLGRPDAGHHPDLRNRGHPDRHRLRADQPILRRRAARRRPRFRSSAL
jgi:Sodium/hydrogen exchanger family